METFNLPKKWCIKDSTDKQLLKFFENYNHGRYNGNSQQIFHYPRINGNCLYSSIQKGYTLITFDQFEKYVLKKEIIGYKLKEEFKHYEKAAKSIAGIERFMSGEWHFTYDSPTYGEIKKAGVLDLWFNPVYEETKTLPKINGYEGTKLNNSTVKYGCAELDIDALRSLIQCSELGSSNRTIHSVILNHGETVTIEQIKQIVEYYK